MSTGFFNLSGIYQFVRKGSDTWKRSLKEIRQKEKDLTTRENQLAKFDERESKLKVRIKELTTFGRNSPQTYNQLMKMTDTIEQLRNENDRLRQYLTERNNQIARQKIRITDLHCQNFAIRLLHYRDRHELQNTRDALQTAEAINQNLYSILEENSDNSPDIYNQDFEMATILELVDAIDGYLTPQDRQILQNQIKRTTRQIRRKYNIQQQIIADLQTERDNITLE